MNRKASAKIPSLRRSASQVLPGQTLSRHLSPPPSNEVLATPHPQVQIIPRGQVPSSQELPSSKLGPKDPRERFITMNRSKSFKTRVSDLLKSPHWFLGSPAQRAEHAGLPRGKLAWSRDGDPRRDWSAWHSATSFLERGALKVPDPPCWGCSSRARSLHLCREREQRARGCGRK